MTSDVPSTRLLAAVRPPRLLRMLIVWVATLIVAAGPIAGMAHFIAVPHTLCEHGELVDLAGHRGDIAPTVDSRSGIASASTGRSILLSAGHDHCAVAAAGRCAAANTGLSDGCATRVPLAARAQGDQRSAPPAGASILSLAPKTSPPLAA